MLLVKFGDDTFSCDSLFVCFRDVMDSKKRKLPDWILSPKKSVEAKESRESDPDDLFDFTEMNERDEKSEANRDQEKPVKFIMSPKELEEIARELLSERK